MFEAKTIELDDTSGVLNFGAYFASYFGIDINVR
jgi:hypothetical protein